MALVKQTMTALTNGVSQQPDPVRLDSQAEEQINGLSDVIDGVGSRPPITYVGSLGVHESDISTTLVTASDNQDYLIVIDGSGTVRAFRKNGEEVTITVDVDNPDYLVGDSKNFEVTSAGGDLFILNKQVEVAMSTDLSPGLSQNALIWVKQGVPDTKYRIDVKDYIFQDDSVTKPSGDDTEWDSLERVEGIGYDEYENTETVIKEKMFCFTELTDQQSDVGDICKLLVEEFNTQSEIWSAKYSSVQSWPTSSDQDTSGFGELGMWYASQIGDGSVATIGLRVPSLGQRDGGFSNWEDTSPFANGYNATWIHGDDDGRVYVTHRTSPNLDELPRSGAPEGMKIQITGVDKDDTDDFYVQVVEGAWQETVGAGIEYKIDKTTMPLVLVLEDDGTFKLSEPKWKEKDAGDDETTPNPTIVGNRITDIGVHRNRLVLSTEDSVVMSESGDLLNFFQKSARDILDTDPIDVAFSSGGASKRINTYALASINQKLFCFGENAQAVVSGSDDRFSPTTVGADIASYYSCNENTAPLVVGDHVFFVGGDDPSGSRVYDYRPNQAGGYQAEDMTAHCPTYVPPDIDMFEGGQEAGMLLGRSASDKSTLYIHRFFFSGNQKLQSSWSKWTMPDGLEILGLDVDDLEIYMTVSVNWRLADGSNAESQDTTSHIMKISFEDVPTEPGVIDYQLKLDALCTVQASALYPSYDSSTNRTLVQFPPGNVPYLPDNPTIVIGGSRGGYVIDDADIELIGSVGSKIWTLEVPGKLEDDDPVYIGSPFEFRYTLSKLFLKNNDGKSVAPVTTGRLQLKRMRAGLKESGPIEVNIMPEGRPVYSFGWTPRVANRSNLGAIVPRWDYFDFDIGCNALTTQIEFINRSTIPGTIISLEWVANFFEKSTGRG